MFTIDTIRLPILGQSPYLDKDKFREWFSKLDQDQKEKASKEFEILMTELNTNFAPLLEHT